jgi:hypothetical protein
MFYNLADGFLDLAADVRQGTRRDAILYSVSANAVHGKRRTNADKRRAVTTLLNDEEWSQWKQVDIARKCSVSREYVSRLQSQLKGSGELTCDRSQVTYTTKHGTVSTMNTARIGHARDHPDVTPEQMAIDEEICWQCYLTLVFFYGKIPKTREIMSKEVEQQLRDAIIQSKLSYHELMRMSGVSYTIIGRFVNGQRTLTLPVASKLAKALGLELKPK